MLRSAKIQFFLILLFVMAFNPVVIGQFTRGGGFGYSNTLNFSTEWYSSTGIDARSNPFAWSLSGSPNIDLFGQSLPFSFLLSNYQNSFTQPFNFFGVSPSYKWAKVHLGYRNISFSPFTLGGHRILGAGVELNPGKWDIGFAYGRLRKSIEPDSTFRGIVPGVFQLSPSFSRLGYAAKLGYGRPDSAYVALTYLNAWDRENSLDDAFIRYDLRPQANTVLGLSSSFRVLAKLFWKTDIAVSAYSRDRNADTIDLGDNSLLQALNNIFSIKESSQGFLAAETSLAWQDKKFGLAAKYRRIDPDFKSMGTYYLQTDLEQYSLSPTIRLTRGVVRGTIGWQRDNLSELKSRTSERFIGNAMLDLQISTAFGFSVQYANFGFTQTPLARNLLDTTLLEQVNQNISVMPRWFFSGQKMTHALQLVFSYNELADRRTDVFVPTELSSLQASIAHSISFLERGLGVNMNVFMTNNESGLLSSRTLGGGAGIQKSLLKGKSDLSLNGTYFSNDFGESGTSNTWQVYIQMGVPVSAQHRFNIGGQWLHNEGIDQTITPTFSEWRFRTGYAFTFNSKQNN